MGGGRDIGGRVGGGWIGKRRERFAGYYGFTEMYINPPQATNIRVVVLLCIYVRGLGRIIYLVF